MKNFNVNANNEVYHLDFSVTLALTSINMKEPLTSSAVTWSFPGVCSELTP